MGWKFVLVPAYEADAVPGYPAHPIAPGGPPPGIWPDPGNPRPEHPIYNPPGIWPTPPPGSGGPPPGIWPDPGFPRPEHPIAPGGPPPGIWPGPERPVHPIAPGGPPPGFWGGVAPPLPTHPIAPGGLPPGIWPGPGGPVYPSHPIARPEPPVDPGYGIPEGEPPSPVFDPDNMPEHPELPDLNSGYWMRAFDPQDRTIFRVFVAGPVGDSPEEPVNRTPGDWVVVRDTNGMPAWAWRPEPVESTAPEEPPSVIHHDKA